MQKMRKAFFSNFDINKSTPLASCRCKWKDRLYKQADLGQKSVSAISTMLFKFNISLFEIAPLRAWFINSVHKNTLGSYYVQELARYWINNTTADV